MNAKNDDAADADGMPLIVDDGRHFKPDWSFGLLPALDRIFLDKAMLHCANQTIPSDVVSDRPLRISEFEPQCACTRVSPTSVTIPPGEAVTVDMVLDLTPATPEQAQSVEWSFQTAVTANIQQTAERTFRWQVAGTVRNLMMIQEEPQLLRRSIVEAVTPDEFDVRVQTSNSVRMVSADMPREFGEVTLIPLDEESRQYSLRIKPAQFNSRGRHRCQVVCHHALPDRSRTLKAAVPLVFDVKPAVVAIPPVLSLGNLSIGDSQEESLNLLPRLDADLEVLDVSVPTSSGITVVAGQQDRPHFEVTQQGRAVGNQSAIVSFTVALLGRTAITEVRVPVTYFGVTKETSIAESVR